ncbi:MAG TPA: 16S rRNA (cytosine(967)-C(5))-methyltransferase RsmB [Bacilli bacterium]|nr:16S rRNA (cytosine(967)-C(5))-methyltransferase RsmB [Bacilli bacterium]
MNVRKIALEAIDKIINKKAFSNIVVNEFLNKFELSSEDKALFTNLVYGTIQNLMTIDFYIEPYILRKKPKPWVKNLLYMSIYQLVYLDIPSYAVVNESVDLANVKDKAIGSFVNAVLRNFLRNPLRSLDGYDDLQRLSIKYSHPLWLVAYLLKDYRMEELEKILQENSGVKKDAIRINTLKTTKAEVIDKLLAEKIKYTETPLVKDGLIIHQAIVNNNLFTTGAITMQDISSQMVSEMAAPAPNSIILDLCAAPGGKSAHLSAIMGNTGTIFACDVYPHKIKLMEKTFARLGVNNVKTQLIDARNIANKVKEESFDYLIADVPCSGLGVLSHKVDLKYKITIKAIEEVEYLQEEILEKSYKLLKRNGFLVYSTCTINKDENEKQIAKFLRRHPDFEKVEEKIILPFEHQTDGFYICKLRRK